MRIMQPYALGSPLFCSGGFGLEIEKNSWGYIHGSAEFLVEPATGWKAGIEVKGHEISVSGGTGEAPQNESWHYYGAGLILTSRPAAYRAGRHAQSLALESVTGVARRKQGDYTRWNFEFSADTHTPLGRQNALAARLASRSLITGEDSLPNAELYRCGGYRSVRGYNDKVFAFRSLAYLQTEIHRYFGELASVYIFSDGGLGIRKRNPGPTIDDATPMLGYGIGLRMPVKIGIGRFEWARNFRDGRSLGRLHAGIHNDFYTETPW
jgi:hypothetical protein